MRNDEICGQLSLFDLTTESGFCWDDDINQIYKMIVDIAEKYNFQISREEWSIWDHVPYLGYRMALTLEVPRYEMTNVLDEELTRIVDFANERNIELSPFAPHYFSLEEDPNEVGPMYIYSMFKDKQRQKIKTRKG